MTSNPNTSLIRTGALLLFTAGLLSIGGCSSGKSSVAKAKTKKVGCTINSVPMYDVKKADGTNDAKDCCNTDGTIKLAGAPAKCPSPYGSNGVAGAQDQASRASTAAAGNLSNADRHISDSTTGDRNGTALASTAGGIPLDTLTKPATPEGLPPDLPALPKVQTAGAGSSGGGGSNGQSVGLGQVKTGVLEDPNKGLDGSIIGGDTGTAYTGGGNAGPKGGNGGINLSGLFGNGDGGDRGPANSADIGFGAADGVRAMGTADPADYFTRIAIDDSIFKKVERRYTEKAMTWATQEVKVGTKSAKGIPAPAAFRK